MITWKTIFGRFAYPSPSEKGMTLLDYYAGQALTALINEPNMAFTDEALAKQAYVIARHMIKERSKIEREFANKLAEEDN